MRRGADRGGRRSGGAAVQDNPQKAADGATNGSAEVVAETPTTIFGTRTGLPDFGTTAFTGSQVDGRPIAAADPDAILPQG